jgi:protein SCO1/2
MTKRIIIMVCIAGVVIAGTVAVALFRGNGDQVNGRSIGIALIGGPFNLVDHSGRAVSEKSWPDRHLLVFFGYTNCPDICPTELQTIAVALDGLGDKAQSVQALFITVDPERDTPEVLAAYVAAFHPRIIGLTGSGEQVRAAGDAYRIYSGKIKSHVHGEYLMSHSSFVYLIGANGQYLTHFRPNTDPAEMARKIGAYL